MKAAEQMLATTGKRIVGDKGYDSDLFRKAMADEGVSTTIPSRSNRKRPAPFHRAHYRLRHGIENFFQRIKRWRAISTRYDKLDLNFLSSVQLVAILDWLTHSV